jgi:chemotaxis protein CheD
MIGIRQYGNSMAGKAVSMQYIVGVGEMKVAEEPGDLIVTHSLGSCLGISAYDAEASVGGILHVMLPSSSVSPDKGKVNPYLFVDLGTPLFFKALFSAGAKKDRLQVKVAGGAAPGAAGTSAPFFDIGCKNVNMLHRLFRKNGIKIAGENVGGQHARTMYLALENGKTWLQVSDEEVEL